MTAREHLQPPSDQPVTARLAAAGSRLQELRALLRASGSNSSTGELRALVIDDNVTNKRSAVSREKVWHQLRTRYLLEPAEGECVFTTETEIDEAFDTEREGLEALVREGKMVRVV